MKNYGVLQIEPTDFCNLRCVMCAPQLKNLKTLHGDLPKGYMDPCLFHKIVDDLSQSNVCFDHLIFQWLGDPTLHPKLMEMVSYAADHIRDRFNYFRIDTNAIALTPARADKLVELYKRHPEFPILVVFSLDAVSETTYARVKGAPGTVLKRVKRHIDHLVQARSALQLEPTNLNLEFQFVLQPGNAHEAREFVDHWDNYLSEGQNGVGYNDIMLKRLSVDAGGEGQLAADLLYEETLKAFDLRPFSKPHVHLKIWERRPWEKTATPAQGSGKHPSSDMTAG